jgi:hypothetical protein
MKIFKMVSFIICIVVFFSCDSENSLDCFQATGDIIEEDFNVDVFKKIQVWERVQLIISQGDTQRVYVETGENLINEIKVKVEDSILTVSDGNSCNFVRDYIVTKVYVTSPNIDFIRNNSGFAVESRGVISFPDLSLVSEGFNGEYHLVGDFIMDNLDVRILRIRANGLSKFYLSGKANQGYFNASDSDVRIEAGDLEIGELFFIHRSTNKMIVNPRQRIKGEIMGLGNVISKNRPPTVQVEELYTGRLIFE